MKQGFTLAEVLITLGIIGVVVALTLPSIVAHQRKVEYSSRLKKFYSMMEQVIRMSEEDNGEILSWTRSGETQMDDEGKTDYDANGKVSKDFFSTYFLPYFKYTKFEDGKNVILEDGAKSGQNPKVYLPDGSTISLWNGGCMDIIFDVNGDSMPNEKGRDRYVFLFCFNSINRTNLCGNADKAFCSYGQNITSRDRAFDLCKNEVNHNYCSRLLQFDEWEFKKDYPHRL